MTLHDNIFVFAKGDFDLSQARRHLRNVGTPTPALLCVYGKVLAKLLTHLAQKPTQRTAGDAQFVATYMEAVAALPVETLFSDFTLDNEATAQEAMALASEHEEPSREGLEFCRIFLGLTIQALQRMATKPLYNELVYVCAALRLNVGIHGLHPVLEDMLHVHRETIDNLLACLVQACEIERAYLAAYGNRLATQQGATDVLLQALSPAMLAGLWNPANAAVQERMWCAYHPVRGKYPHFTAELHEDDALEAQLIRLMLEPGEQHAHAFSALQGRVVLRPIVLGSLFPLRLPTGDATAFVEALVPFFANWSKGDTRQELTVLFERHNPQLLQLLSLHEQLYPNAEDTCSNAWLLAEPVQYLAGSTALADTVELPEL